MLRAARREPRTLFVAIDPVHAALAHASATAARRRGGAPNAIFVAASIEALPAELAGVATRLTVLLPWGSLLRAVALPDPRLLANARALCRPGAALDVVFSASPTDAAELTRAGLFAPDPAARESAITAAYTAAGFDALVIRELPPGSLGALDTTWARRLAGDSRRRVWRLSAVAR